MELSLSVPGPFRGRRVCDIEKVIKITNNYHYIIFEDPIGVLFALDKDCCNILQDGKIMRKLVSSNKEIELIRYEDFKIKL